MKARLAASVMAALLAVPASGADADAACKTRKCKERVARKQCTQTRPRACVERAILTYRLSGWQAAWMRRIPACESTWNPRAVSAGGHLGLYQFHPGTWAGLRYRRRSPLVAKWAALGAALMVRMGRTNEWSCK